MPSIETSVIDSLYTIVYTNTTLGRSVEEGLNVWICENLAAFRQALGLLKGKPHLRVISAGPSILKRAT
ncbi:hypothetical protein [Roseiconus lacunae]|uniref:hypothetical protein n=1 Tax=Roseiconus lacunae TaxID=2605694 RepID=UPI001E50EC0C|nr:hypothetical protein [Roseiconus lacunae]MCD0459538.1 hypothetical protein [Roseiconus lacunae]